MESIASKKQTDSIEWSKLRRARGALELNVESVWKGSGVECLILEINFEITIRAVVKIKHFSLSYFPRNLPQKTSSSSNTYQSAYEPTRSELPQAAFGELRIPQSVAAFLLRGGRIAIAHLRQQWLSVQRRSRTRRIRWHSVSWTRADGLRLRSVESTSVLLEVW